MKIRFFSLFLSFFLLINPVESLAESPFVWIIDKFFSFIKPCEGATESPFVWIVEKEKKISYLMGTAHMGVSLEDMPCSDQILKQIQNSDLLFLEVKPGDDYEKLSEAEKKKLFIGSIKEQEEVLSQLSAKSQEIVRERKAAQANHLRVALSLHLQSKTQNETKGAFSELSRDSQDFLLKYGVNPEGNHADFFHFIIFLVYYKAYFSLPPFLEKQIKRVALSHSIEIKALDDNKRINQEVQSRLSSSKKPITEVNYTDIERSIGEMDKIADRIKRDMLKEVQAYKTYNNEHFLKRTMGWNEGDIHGEIFFKNRNELWLEKFLEARKEYEQVFLAAGLPHLIGGHNLLDMLKGQGFSIERMPCSE